MGRSRYFLEIEIVYEKHGLLLSLRKYMLDFLEETSLFRCKPATIPIELDLDGVKTILCMRISCSIGG